jgi:hypothetical protein
MKPNILIEALKEARRMLPRHPQFQYYPHFTFLYQNGQLISCGKNTGHEPPKHLGYHARLNGGKPKVHSEFQSFKKARRRLNLNESFVCVNIRLNKKSEAKLSKPCDCCYNFLKALGCNRFYYTGKNGDWEIIL